MREAELSVEVVCRFEIVHGPGFKAESFVSAAVGFGDDVLKDGAGDAFAEEIFGGPHRFYLAVSELELFESSATRELVARPPGPECDVGFTEAAEIQRMDAFGRGKGMHGVEVFLEQGMDLRSGQVVDTDAQWYLWRWHRGKIGSEAGKGKGEV